MMRRSCRVLLGLVAALVFAAGDGVLAFNRGDARVDSDPGIRIFVREVRASVTEDLGNPVLLIHGGGPGSLPNFEPMVPNYSLAEDIASVGHVVYLMDVRGFGNSTKPSSMASTDPKAPPAVSADEAVRDIAAVVNWIRLRSREDRVALVGVGAGGAWAAQYATKNADRVSHLVLVNALYGVKAPWPPAKTLADAKNPDVFNPWAGAGFFLDASGLLADWDRSIPAADKSTWRDPRVAVSYVSLTLDGGKAPSIRIPGAFRKEHFEMAQGRKLWDARDLRVPTMYVRGSLDHWSRPEDLQALLAELVNAPRKQFVLIHDATHYLYLDRPEKGRAAFVQELLVFLGNRQPAREAQQK